MFLHVVAVIELINTRLKLQKSQINISEIVPRIDAFRSSCESAAVNILKNDLSELARGLNVLSLSACALLTAIRNSSNSSSDAI